MVKSQSRKSREEIKGREPNFRSLKSLEKSTHKSLKRNVVGDYDDIDHFLNDFLDKGLEIFEESKGFDDWFNNIPTESSMIDEMIDFICVDPDDRVLNNGSGAVLGQCSDIDHFLNTQSVTSAEFEIWSPTPEYSGFEAAEYLLNFLTSLEEDENNINPSLPNREEKPD